MVIFSLMNLYGKRSVAAETAKKEDKKIEEDIKKAQVKQDEKKTTPNHKLFGQGRKLGR